MRSVPENFRTAVIRPAGAVRALLFDFGIAEADVLERMYSVLEAGTAIDASEAKWGSCGGRQGCWNGSRGSFGRRSDPVGWRAGMAGPTEKATVRHRREIAWLKRQVAQLGRQVAALRGVGKREAKARLGQLGAATKAARPKSRPP